MAWRGDNGAGVCPDSHAVGTSRAVGPTATGVLPGFVGIRAKSVALLHGGLRWLCIGDDALTFLREAPGETILVHAAREDHTPVRIPATVVGTEFAGLAGATDLRVDADGLITLPADGPAFGIWRLVGV